MLEPPFFICVLEVGNVELEEYVVHFLRAILLNVYALSINLKHRRVVLVLL